MKVRIAACICTVAMCFTDCGPPPNAKKQSGEKVKLVVAIVVDQMRADYIPRFWNRFGDGGFRRLVGDGFNFRDAHYNYIPTYTGPGHASLFTGTTPRHHGIIANDWFELKNNNTRYCVYDHDEQTVGGEGYAGKMSPANLLAPTIGDELEIASNGKARVFAVALKDRSAVLPAGHASDGAFWLDEEKGIFVTSSWYMSQPPAWLNEFNAEKRVQTYLSKPWETLYPLDTYTLSLPDSNEYEKPLPGAETPTFPYDFSKALKEGKLSVIRSTAYGNTLTKDIAIACISGEQLGKDEIPDFISISFSSTDIIGHAYGPRSVEIEDTYLRLDKEIEEILKYLDKEVGYGNYVVSLSADHGGGDVSSHLEQRQIPGGYVYEKELARILKDFCRKLYKDTSIIASVSNEQVFLNLPRVYEKGYDRATLESQLCDVLISTKGIAAAYPSKVLKYETGEGDQQLLLLKRGYHFKRSGQIAYLYEPSFVDYSRKGATHGSGYAYDTHVPLIFFGAGIPAGESYNRVYITQMAPTLTEMLKIQRPAACTDEPLNGYFQTDLD